MAGFAKIFETILTSTIWQESDHVLRVWLTMLVRSDKDGRVEGSVPGFAHIARVSIEQMEDALRVLSSPDPHSRTKEYEGRRIEETPGGWLILNYIAYRERGAGSESARAPYMRDYMRKYRKEKKGLIEVLAEKKASRA